MVIRYPGGKDKLKKRIVAILRCMLRYNKIDEYREPFFGAGAIGRNLMRMILGRDLRVWISDEDPGIAALWTSIIQAPEELKELIMSFTPTVGKFDEFKEFLLTHDGCLPQEMVEYGFRKLALHQISWSGLGTRAGGPQGGRSQTSEYHIGSRWNAKRMVREIDELHHLFSRFQVESWECGADDFEWLLDPRSYLLIYLDPPYWKAGGQLYQHFFTERDHQRLAGILRETPARWLLSYDDHPAIRDLYSWADIDEIEVGYSISKGQNTRKTELLITREKFLGTC